MKIMRNLRSRRAFTLIELLVVILILAILAALIVPRVVGRTGDAKRAKAATDISTLTGMLQQYRVDCDQYPSTEDGLMALRQQPSNVNGWRGPYSQKELPQVLTDKTLSSLATAQTWLPVAKVMPLTSRANNSSHHD